MKVLHVLSTSFDGGAAKGALALHNGLLAAGIDSKIFTFNLGENRVKGSLDFKVKSNIINRLAQSLIFYLNKFLLFKKNRKGVLFSYDFFTCDYGLVKYINSQCFDIVHLHWFNGGFLSAGNLEKIKTKVVITPRDYWLLTGGCHYPLNCVNYLEGCFSCPLVNTPGSLTNYLWTKKRLLGNLKNVHFTALSPFFFKELREAFSDKVEYIPNTVDLSGFEILERRIAREKLGLDPNGIYLCLGVNNGLDEYKGFSNLSHILDSIVLDINLLIFGRNIPIENLKSNVKVVDFGFIREKSILNLIYNSSDLFLMLSLQETFGKTVIESLSCGTPIIAWDKTGPSSLVESTSVGLIIEKGNIEAYSEGLISVIRSTVYFNRRDCRELALAYSNINLADSYKNLYQKLISN